MSTCVNMVVFYLLYSAERVISDVAEDKVCCASPPPCTAAGLQLVACLRAAAGQTPQLCLTLCSLVHCVEVTSIPAGGR